MRPALYGYERQGWEWGRPGTCSVVQLALYSSSDSSTLALACSAAACSAVLLLSTWSRSTTWDIARSPVASRPAGQPLLESTYRKGVL